MFAEKQSQFTVAYRNLFFIDNTNNVTEIMTIHSYKKFKARTVLFFFPLKKQKDGRTEGSS